MRNYCVLNGELIKTENARLNLNDLAIIRGFGVFDYFLVRNKTPLFIEDYLNRFFNSSQLLGLSVPFNKVQVKEKIQELIAANKEEEGGIRLVLTGGYAMDSYTPIKPNFLILEYSLPTYSQTTYQQGIKIASHPHQRELPEVKSINYITGIKVTQEIKKAGIDDFVYHDRGILRESARSNVFFVTPEDVLVTPSEKILPGITRGKVLGLAKDFLKVEEREATLQELQQAKEVFFTSSIKGGGFAVVEIDGQKIGDGKPGPIAKQLRKKYHELTCKYVGAELEFRYSDVPVF